MSADPNVPAIFDPASLQYAVNHDPQAVFYKLCNMVSARDQAFRERDDALTRAENIREEVDKVRFRLRREEDDHHRTKVTLETVKSQLNQINKDFVSLGKKCGFLDIYKDELRQEIHDLKEELKSSNQNHRGARMDHQQVLQLCESLQYINDAKTVVLWKFIDRLQAYIAYLRNGGDPDPNFERMIKWQISQSHEKQNTKIEARAPSTCQNTIEARPEIADYEKFHELGVKSTNTAAVSESDGLSDVSTIAPLGGSDVCPRSPSRKLEIPKIEENCVPANFLPSKESQVGLMGPPKIPTYAQVIYNNATRPKSNWPNSQMKRRDSSTDARNKAAFNPSAVSMHHQVPTPNSQLPTLTPFPLSNPSSQ
jgi:hypothetical protein